MSMANIPRVPGRQISILDKVDIASMYHKPALECDSCIFHVHITVYKSTCSSGVNMNSSIYRG